MQSKVSIINCADYNIGNVFASVKEAVNLIGGIDTFIGPSDTVLIKPNILCARPAECAISTNPEFVRAVIRLVKSASPAKIIVGDSPSAYEDRIDLVYEVSGIKKIADEEAVELIRFDKYIICSGIPIASIIKQKNVKLINVPKFKTHNLTMITGAIKNNFGLVPGMFKLECHKKYFKISEFNKMIVGVFKEAGPCLSIMDAIIAMEGDGPTNGKLRNLGAVLASADAVALDSVMADIMGYKPNEVPMIDYASGLGLGNCDLGNIEILGQAKAGINAANFIKARSNSPHHMIPPIIVEMLGRFVRIVTKADADTCTRCGICVKGCPTGAISLVKNMIKINYDKCIACFCCREFCPTGAMRVKEPFALSSIRFLFTFLKKRSKDAHTNN